MDTNLRPLDNSLLKGINNNTIKLNFQVYASLVTYRIAQNSGGEKLLRINLFRMLATKTLTFS